MCEYMVLLLDPMDLGHGGLGSALAKAAESIAPAFVDS